MIEKREEGKAQKRCICRAKSCKKVKKILEEQGILRQPSWIHNNNWQKAEAERMRYRMEEAKRFYGMEGQEREIEMGENSREWARAKLLEQLKEEEKVQRQEEYEQHVAQAVDEVFRLAAGKGGAAEREQVEKILDSIQNMAFQEGYHYAIAVLEECLIQ